MRVVLAFWQTWLCARPTPCEDPTTVEKIASQFEWFSGCSFMIWTTLKALPWRRKNHWTWSDEAIKFSCCIHLNNDVGVHWFTGQLFCKAHVQKTAFNHDIASLLRFSERDSDTLLVVCNEICVLESRGEHPNNWMYHRSTWECIIVWATKACRQLTTNFATENILKPLKSAQLNIVYELLVKFSNTTSNSLANLAHSLAVINFDSLVVQYKLGYHKNDINRQYRKRL